MSQEKTSLLASNLLFFERLHYLRQRPRKPRFQGRFARGFFEQVLDSAKRAIMREILGRLTNRASSFAL